jgi:hypothetical protein
LISVPYDRALAEEKAMNSVFPGTKNADVIETRKDEAMEKEILTQGIVPKSVLCCTKQQKLEEISDACYFRKAVWRSVIMFTITTVLLHLTLFITNLFLTE